MQVKELQYVKLMWLPTLEKSLLVMENESVFTDSKLTHQIMYHLDLATWYNHFRILYKSWLIGESEEIFIIQSNINFRIISKIEKLNQKLKGVKLFYWFDVDRSQKGYDHFCWSHCPLSDAPLIELKKMHLNNRFISPNHPVVSPG